MFAALAFLEVHPALLPLLCLCILLGKALIALPTLLQLALHYLALPVVLVCDFHILHDINWDSLWGQLGVSLGSIFVAGFYSRGRCQSLSTLSAKSQ